MLYTHHRRFQPVYAHLHPSTTSEQVLGKFKTTGHPTPAAPPANQLLPESTHHLRYDLHLCVAFFLSTPWWAIQRSLSQPVDTSLVLTFPAQLHFYSFQGVGWVALPQREPPKRAASHAERLLSHGARTPSNTPNTRVRSPPSSFCHRSSPLPSRTDPHALYILPYLLSTWMCRNCAWAERLLFCMNERGRRRDGWVKREEEEQREGSMVPSRGRGREEGRTIFCPVLCRGQLGKRSAEV